jgi:uncharacterized ion transporter superfamily protein YfcC
MSFEVERPCEGKMKRVMIALAILFAFNVSAVAEMSRRQDGGMMNGGWWWGINSAWYFTIGIAILIVTGIFLILKRTRVAVPGILPDLSSERRDGLPHAAEVRNSGD